MAKKRVIKKKKVLSLVKNSPVASGLKSVSIKSDYFVRFRYSREELFIILQSEPVRSLHLNSQTREILDDMGYWTLVRSESSTNYRFDSELESRLIAHCDFLEDALKYDIGEKIWVQDSAGQFIEAKIIEHHHKDDSDFFIVEWVDSSKSKNLQIFSKYELDQVNLIGCFLPQDHCENEIIDWDKDLIWRKRLDDFKEYMAAKNLEIDFRKTSEDVQAQIKLLKQEILVYFKINQGQSRQLGRGLGLRSCGEGGLMDQFLIYFAAFQAFGHIFGIKLTDIEDLTRSFFAEINNNKFSLSSFRSISEVADKLLARGPIAAGCHQAVKFIEPSVRLSTLTIYNSLKIANSRKAFELAVNESAIFSNIIKINANSI
jgi:hypothetical protein